MKNFKTLSESTLKNNLKTPAEESYYFECKCMLMLLSKLKDMCLMKGINMKQKKRLKLVIDLANYDENAFVSNSIED